MEDGETYALKRVARDVTSASGETWYIRAGNSITLAELFDVGCRLCPCHYLCTSCLRQPMFVHRKGHSRSQSEQAVINRNARRFQLAERGSWRLPRLPG
eukprot:562445-Pyramimonas_sp.AAC.1